MMAVDFCIDDKGKYWWLECNCHPRMSFYLPISLFYQASIDYGGYLDDDSPGMARLRELAAKHIEYTVAIHPTYQSPEFAPLVEGKEIITN